MDTHTLTGFCGTCCDHFARIGIARAIATADLIVSYDGIPDDQGRGEDELRQVCQDLATLAHAYRAGDPARLWDDTFAHDARQHEDPHKRAQAQGLSVGELRHREIRARRYLASKGL